MERDTTLCAAIAQRRRWVDPSDYHLATQYGRYGYRRITALLQGAGWQVGKDRVQRIGRREGLKVPPRQRPRGRLWLHEGSCVRLRPERANHVWSYDLVSALTHDGRSLRLLTRIDEYTRECLAIRVARRLGSQEVIDTLAEVMLVRGILEYLRSDNGPEFVAGSCASGWPVLAPERCTSNPGVPGRTATARVSTASCETSA